MSVLYPAQVCSLFRIAYYVDILAKLLWSDPTQFGGELCVADVLDF